VADLFDEHQPDPAFLELKRRSQDGSMLADLVAAVEAMRTRPVDPWDIPVRIVWTDDAPLPVGEDGEPETPVEHPGIRITRRGAVRSSQAYELTVWTVHAERTTANGSS